MITTMYYHKPIESTYIYGTRNQGTHT